MGNDIHKPDPIVSTVHHEVDLMNPNPATISMIDVALSLSRKGRYNDLSNAPWSVAKHLMFCDALAVDNNHTDPSTRLIVLLHDAHEAYIGDICRPVKRLLNEASNGIVTQIEDRLDEAIFASLGLASLGMKEHAGWGHVKHLDVQALAWEVRAIFPAVEDRWDNLPPTDTDNKFLLHAFRDLWYMRAADVFTAYQEKVTQLQDQILGKEATHHVAGSC